MLKVKRSKRYENRISSRTREMTTAAAASASIIWTQTIRIPSHITSTATTRHNVKLEAFFLYFIKNVNS